VEIVIFMVSLHTMQVRRSISGLLSSFALFTFRLNSCSTSPADGVGLPQFVSVTFPLPSQDLHLTGINSAAWLHRLLHDRVARSTAGRGRVLFYLWCHFEPFRPPLFGGFFHYPRRRACDFGCLVPIVLKLLNGVRR
jgi:hypothetical protein